MTMQKTLQSNLDRLGIQLPAAPAAKGNYLPYVVTGDLVYLSGTLPTIGPDLAYSGKVGKEQDIKSGYEAAKLCLLNAMANLGEASDQFNRLKRIVHLAGYVNGVDGFSDSPKVVNGASDLLVELIGDAGRHSRLAVSVNGLPLNATVEIHLVAEISRP